MQKLLCLFTAGMMAFVVACNAQQPRARATVNVDDEIAKLRKRLETSPTSASLHSQLAALFAAKGDWAQCENEIGKAMQLDPNNPTFYIEVAQPLRRARLSTKSSRDA